MGTVSITPSEIKKIVAPHTADDFTIHQVTYYLNENSIFKSNSDFSSVEIHKVKYSLNATQAKIVKYLFEKYWENDGNSEGVLFKTIYEDVFIKNSLKDWTENSRMSNFFKGIKEFKNIIKPVGSDNSNKWRLNI